MHVQQPPLLPFVRMSRRNSTTSLTQLRTDGGKTEEQRPVWYAINGRHHAGNTLALQLNRANNDDSLDCRDANRSRNADTFYYGRYPHNTANDDQCTSDSRSRSLTGAQPFRHTSLPSPYLSRRHFTSRFKAAVPVPSQRQN